MDRGDWQATVHRVVQSQTQQKQLSMHTKLNKVIQLIVIKLKFKSRPDTKPYIPLKNTKSYFLLVYSSCLKKYQYSDVSLANRILGELRNIIILITLSQGSTAFKSFESKLYGGKRQKYVYREFQNVQYNGKNSIVKTGMDSKYNIQFTQELKNTKSIINIS